MLKKLTFVVIASIATANILPQVGTQTVYAAEEAKTEKKRRRTPAMRSRVYEQLARAQKLADEGKPDEGLAVLDSVLERSSSMNSYEKAMMWNFYGFIYYNMENMPKAAEYFRKLIAEENIPESLEKNTMFSLAQLSMMSEEYKKTITYLNRWEELHKGPIPASNQMLKAQAYYQSKDYKATLEYVTKAIEFEESEGRRVKENWFILQRAAYYELKQPKKVEEVLEKMVRLFNKPDYWVQWAAMQGELGEEKKQLAIMETAYQQGFVTKKTDVRMLAQLYFYHEVPAKAAKVLTDALKSGELDADLKTLQFLAQAWSAAKNDDKAIPVLAKAATISEDGNVDQRLGEMYLNTEQYNKAITSTEEALKKGQLEYLGNAYLVLGMAHFNLKQFGQAINNLEKARDVKATARMAGQWLKYVKREKANADALAASA